MSKTRTYNIELLPFLDDDVEWGISVTDDPDPVISFSFGRWKVIEPASPPLTASPEVTTPSPSKVKTPPPPDVFEVREAFFEIRELDQAVAFFRKFGPWALHEGTKKASPIRFSMLAGQRAFFEEALVSREIWSVKRATTDDELRISVEDWYLWQNLPMELVFGPAQIGLVRCKDVQEALRASVFLDRFDKEPLRRCARPDCGKFFKPGNKQAKLYCSAQCAHLQSARKYSKKKAALQDGGRRPSGK